MSNLHVPGITSKERSLFDDALAYFKAQQEILYPGCVLRFKGIPVDEMRWSERDKIRVVLEYQKETTGMVSRNGNVTIFPPSMSAGAGVKAPGGSDPFPMSETATSQALPEDFTGKADD